MAKNPVPDARKYTYRVIWSEEDQEHIGLVAEFPSLSWLAATPSEALAGITKLVADVLADMVKAKETPPVPLSLEQYSGKILVRIPAEQHRELAIEAAESRVSMNRLISRKLSRT